MSDKNQRSDSNVFGDFFGKILAFLGWDADPDRERKQMLKELRKTLKRSKGHYVRVGPDLADIGLAKFFYEIYSVVANAQTLLANALSSGALKNIVIEMHFTDHQRQLQEELTEERIRARSRELPALELEKEINSKLVDFMAGLEIETQKKIDAQYNVLLSFLDFIGFNYYFLLKKFDSGLPERDFVYLPRFEPINGDYIAEDLKEFLEVAASVNPGTDWDAIFEVLKVYKNLEILDRGKWKKMLANLSSMKKSNLLTQLVMYFSKDPSFRVVGAPREDRIVEPYLSMLKTHTEVMTEKIKSEQKNEKVGQLVKQVFGTTGISRTKYYAEKANLAYQKKMLGGFIFVEPVNYLKAFLLDYFKRDIRDLVNLLLVKGQWTANGFSQPLSESVHAIMEFSDKLTDFDESLADEGERGLKLKGLLLKAERDQNAMSALKQQLKDVNSLAKALIIDCANHLIIIGKHIKMCIDDFAKTKHEVMMNWRNLEGSTEKNLSKWMGETYKMIYYFVQLMQFFVKEEK